MIDSKLFLENQSLLEKGLSLKGVSVKDVKEVAQHVKEKNQLIQKVEQLQFQRNQLSKEMGSFLAQKQKDKAEKVREKTTEIKNNLHKLEKELKEKEESLKNQLLNLPNLPDEKAPIGTSPKDNVEIESTSIKEFEKQVYFPHWEIGKRLDILDQEKASQLSGSLFILLKGSGAKLLRSLVDLAYNTFQKDYTEFIVPSFVNSKTFTGTGHLPKFSNDAYHIEKDDLWAIPTGEVPLTALHQGEILSEEDLPLKYMTYTSCFRREAGSAGQETRGLQRLHEFHKVELVKICHPSQSQKELENLLKDALKPIQLLNLPYRVLDLCTADLTFASARTYDIEVYSPGVKQWLEVSSVGLFTDYQMRRSHIRFRSGKQNLFPHSLNGSGLATPRVLAAIMEIHYEEKENRISVPEALRDFMKCKYIIKKL